MRRLGKQTRATCACDGAAECTVAFTLERDIPAPSFLMYQLENFKQAHRGYVKSVSWDQLTASSVEEAELATAEVGDDGECGDSRKALRAEGNATGPVLFPCGLFAQFVYNDTLELRGADGATVPTDETQLEPGIGPGVQGRRLRRLRRAVAEHDVAAVALVGARVALRAAEAVRQDRRRPPRRRVHDEGDQRV